MDDPAASRVKLLRLGLHLLMPALAIPALAAGLASRSGLSVSDLHNLPLLSSSVLLVYSIDRLPPIELSRHGAPAERLLLLLTAAGSAVACLWLLPPAGEIPWTAFLGCLLLTLAYPRLKRVTGLKNLVVPLAWTWSIAAWSGVQDHVQAAGLLELFCLLTAATLLCDWPEAGTRPDGSLLSLPGFRWSRGLLLVLLLPALLAPASSGFTDGGNAFAGSALLLALLSRLPGVLGEHIRAATLADAALALPGVMLFLSG